MFNIFFYIGGLLVSMLYGSAYLLTIYMKMLNGSEINMGSFLLLMGFGALSSILLINKKLLQHFSSLHGTIIGTICYSIGLILLGIAQDVAYTYSIAILMGLGWGLIYSASILSLNLNIPTARKQHHYSYYAATNALGAGMAPVIFHFLEQYGINLQEFYFGAGLYAGFAAVLCFTIAGKFTQVKQKNYQENTPNATLKLSSIEYHAIFLAFLSACIFSTLTFLQVSFAEIYHLNYAIFFSLITFAMIISRLTLIHWISKANHMLFYLSLIMLGSIIMFLFINTHALIYMVSAILFGVSYGLMYPLIQTMAVAYAHESLHTVIISKFVLAYFMGIFCFPLAGAGILLYWDPRMIIILLAILALIYTTIAAKTLRIATIPIIID